MKKKSLNLIFIGALFALMVFNGVGGAILGGSREIDTAVSVSLRRYESITDVTDKYLDDFDIVNHFNGEVVKSIDEELPHANGSIDVIVKLGGVPATTRYRELDERYSSLADFIGSREGSSLSLSNSIEQDGFVNKLRQKKIGFSVNARFGTLLNAVSLRVKYKDLAKIEALAGGSQNVAISRTYMPAQAASTSSISDPVFNDVKIDGDTGIFDSSDVDYDGSGTIVAVLDTGYDYLHSVFKSEPVGEVAYTRAQIQGIMNGLVASSLANFKVDDIYKSKKIPFAFDYADHDADVYPADDTHGTHVAGIIGGNDDKVRGVAINAQLALFKVFSDGLASGAKTENILMALEDAVILGVDVINMSLGATAGFTRSKDEIEAEVYDAVLEAGISLVVAAGNESSSGVRTTYGDLNLSSNPDSGVVGSPSTYLPSLSVASISGKLSPYAIVDDNFALYYYEAANSAGHDYDFNQMLYDQEGRYGQFDYVVVPGVGYPVNYAGVDVAGKIAFVKRGDISFEDKSRYAAEAGAIACIIYNNVAGIIKMSTGYGLRIPTASISYDQGLVIEERWQGKIVIDAANKAGPFISEFSSWGPTPDLRLKPEITAHGGNIYSAVPGGYDTLSGTSMASPNMAGVVTLIRQYVKDSFPQLTPYEVTTRVNQILMSTAIPAVNEVGNPYSPRQQGAGLANLENAVNTPAYVFTDENTNKTKLELLDDPQKTGVYEMKFYVRNISTDAVSYDVATALYTESLSAHKKFKLVGQTPYPLNQGKLEFVSVSGGTRSQNTITVQGGETAEVVIRHTLSNSEKNHLDTTFENGMYVEGFVKLNSKVNGGINLSVPVLAFYGDWLAVPILDKTVYETDPDRVDQSIKEDDKNRAAVYPTRTFGSYEDAYLLPLGEYKYNLKPGEDIAADEDKNSISTWINSAVDGLYAVGLGLLRGVKQVDISIEEYYSGKVIYTKSATNAYKALSRGTRAYPYYFETEDFRSLEQDLVHGARYRLRVTATPDFPITREYENLYDTYETSFYVDYHAPVVENARYYTEYDKISRKTRTYVEFSVYDEHYIEAYQICTMEDYVGNKDRKIQFDPLSYYFEPVKVERGGVTTIKQDITDYMTRIYNSKNPDALYVYVTDYAMNTSILQLNMPSGGIKSVNFTESDLSMSVNEVKLLEPVLGDGTGAENQPEFWMDTLEWTTSDADVAIVSRGEVFAKGRGTAVISAGYRDNTNQWQTASINITVLGDGDSGYKYFAPPEVTGIQITAYETLNAFTDNDYRDIGDTGDISYFFSSTVLDIYPSESLRFDYTISPWYIDASQAKVTWASSITKFAEVDANTGVITAKSKGSTKITVSVEYNGRKNAATQQVDIEVLDPFVTLAYMLQEYRGLGGEVSIPANLELEEISDYAFARSIYARDDDGNYILDADDYMMYEVIGKSNVTKVIIPEGIKVIGAYAFFDSPYLTEVVLPSTVHTIKAYAFANCPNLRNINLEHVKRVGESAFESFLYTKNQYKQIQYVSSVPSQVTFTNMESLEYIGTMAFANNSTITSVNLQSLNGSGMGAFAGCSNLTSVVIGAESILGKSMFLGCAKLYSVNILAAEVPDYAFANSGVTSITFGANTRYIGEGAFSDLKRLASISVTLPNREVIIDGSAFANSNVTTLVFGANTRIINERNAFAGMSKLTTFTINASNPYYKTQTASGHKILYNADITEIVKVASDISFSGGIYSVPATLKVIGNGAFSNMVSGLSRVDFPASSQLERIEAYAFFGATSLQTVTFPSAGSFVIGESAFENCINLSILFNINTATSIGDFAFYNTKATSASGPLTFGDNVVIGFGAFAENKAISGITLGANAVVGDYAFFGATALGTVNMPALGGVKFGAYSFYSCTSLTTLDFTKAVGEIPMFAFTETRLSNINLGSITKIGTEAFSGSALVSVSMPNVVEIETAAFADCYNLISVTNTSKLKIIGNDVFYFAGSGHILLGSSGYYVSAGKNFVMDLSSVEYIGDYAFCFTTMTTVDLSSARYIGSAAFMTSHESIGVFSSIQSIVFGDNLKEISPYAFSRATALTTLNLNKVEIVGEGAFYINDGLTTVVAPNLKVVGMAAFASAPNLASFAAPKLETLGAEAFSGAAITDFTLGESLKYFSGAAFSGVPLNKFEKGGVDTFVVNDKYFVEGGVLYSILPNGGYNLDLYPAALTATQYTVKDGTVRIGEFAFNANQNIQKVIMPSTLEAIGSHALNGCVSLSTVRFNTYRAPALEAMVTSELIDWFIYLNGSDGVNVDFSKVTSIEEYKVLRELANVPDGLYDSTSFYLDCYFFANFVDMVGFVDGLTIEHPSNGLGYDVFAYRLYFGDSVMLAEVCDDRTRVLIANIDALPTNIDVSFDVYVRGLRNTYNSLSSAQKAFVTNLSKLEAAELRIAYLKENPPKQPDEAPKGLCGNVAFFGDSNNTTALGAVAVCIILLCALTLKRGKNENYAALLR